MCTGWQVCTHAQVRAHATGEDGQSCSSKYACAQQGAKQNIPPSYLPRAHYKEYLVSLINAHSLDPATLYEVEELETAAERYLHVRPQPLAGEDVPTYHIRLLQVKPTPSLSSDSMLWKSVQLVSELQASRIIIFSLLLQKLMEEVPLGQSIPRRRK